MVTSNKLTNRFLDALNYAFHLHANQKRKGKDIPYFAHLIGVTSLVLEMGGNEDEAIAALLHDAVEDQGGLNTLKTIRERFGNNVANIVNECSDSYSIPKPEWRKRKEQYIEKLKSASLSVLRVSLADKIHNSRTILIELYENGNVIWNKFNGKKEGTLWYYRTLTYAYKNFPQQSFVTEFKRVVNEIDKLANRNEQ